MSVSSPTSTIFARDYYTFILWWAHFGSSEHFDASCYCARSALKWVQFIHTYLSSDRHNPRGCKVKVFCAKFMRIGIPRPTRGNVRQHFAPGAMIRIKIALKPASPGVRAIIPPEKRNVPRQR